jgi:hypothetical protein
LCSSDTEIERRNRALGKKQNEMLSVKKTDGRDQGRDQCPGVKQGVFEIGHGTIGADRQNGDCSTMQAVVDGDLVVQRVAFFKI